jgi:methyl-CpG-binding domain protein 2
LKGWIREEIPRSSGGISGNRKADVYYISPSGKKIRSKPELLKILGDHYDLTTFDYFTGKINPSMSTNASGAKVKTNGTSKTQYDFTKSLRNDASLVPPIRQTASIFKQPVTVSLSVTKKLKFKYL